MIYSHNRDIDIAFYNDRVKEVIDAGLIAEPFTYIPIRAGHMELITGNAIVFGKVTEGYDPIELEIEREVTYEDIDSIGETVNLTVHKVMLPILPADWFPSFHYRRGVIQIFIPYQVIEGGIYAIHGECESRWSTGLPVNITAYYTAGPGETAFDVKAGLKAAFLAAPGVDPADWVDTLVANMIEVFPAWKAFGNAAGSPKPTAELIYSEWQISAFILDFDQIYTTKYSILKHGATHSFGIVYKDSVGRCCSVLRHSRFELYLPFFTETGGPNVSEKANVTFKISNNPPQWAESYEIVYAGNVSMDDFLQIRIFNISVIPIDANRYALSIQETMDHTRYYNNRWKVPDWRWEDGDRIRLIGTIDALTGVVTEYTADKGYDYEIEETNTQYGDAIGGDWLIIQAKEHPASFNGEVNILAEIYRPRIGLGETIYYGTGMVFEVGTNEYGLKYHKGDVDQDIGSDGEMLIAAQVYNTANDAWLYRRINYRAATGVLQLFWAESNIPSDWWRAPTKLTSAGWPFLYDSSMRMVELHQRIRFGGKLIEGTKTNNIAHFVFDGFVDLPEKNGDITALKEIGYTLKVLQMYKETSIYIERIQTFNPDGTEQFTLVNHLLGSQRPEETDYGCQHPESVLVNDRYLYYWDNSEGKYIRSAPNGQFPISDIKMKRWFKNLLEWIKVNGGGSKLQVYSGMNVEHDEVWVSFAINNLVEGAIFSEKRGRWITRYDQRTESYIHLGNWFAHMYNQRLYIINPDEGQDWLSWAGVPTVAEVQFPSNIEPLRNKVFNAIAVYADHLWSCLSRYITIPQEASNVLMETYISVWDRREGVYYGKILKDQNSPGNFVSDNARTMNGREIRGRYCYFRLRTEEHDEKVRLDSVIIFSTVSERHA